MALVRKIRCAVARIVDHGGRVYTLELAPEKEPPAFRPGQFLHLALDAYDPSGFWPESRVFSIASSPLRRERLSITYSVQGRFTARMEKELAEGKFVWIKLPYGEFIIRDLSDVVLFAGGTGITAFTAFLDALTPSFPHTIYLAYGARASHLFIYRDWVERRAAVVSQLKPFYFIEQDPGGEFMTRSDFIGRVSVAVLWQQIENPMTADYYISGPPPMLQMISQDLRDRGIGAGLIWTDAWEGSSR